MDKLKGNHGHEGTTTAGDAYDKGATKHHGTHGTTGTTHGTNTTGAAYGEPAGRTGALPGQEPYATHGNTQHSGLTGTHGTSATTAGHPGGLTGSNRHEGSTLPGGAAGYGGHGTDSRAPGAYNNNDGLDQRGGAYGESNTHGGILGGHHDNNTHGSHEKGGLLGRKKDDLEESLTREQKAKAELDAAMARHNEARQHADKQLNEKERAAEEELRAAEERLRKAQEIRRQAGH